MLVVGLGAAGIAVAKMLQSAGVSDIIGCDRKGAVSTERSDYQDATMTPVKRWFADHTNHDKRQGKPEDVIEGADVFIGLSGPKAMPASALKRMNRDAMMFAMSNPTPEITPEEAEPYVRIIATGRSDYPNQINNVLCFPGIFRGALDVRARDITEEMKMAAARGIASIVSDAELSEDYVIPSVFNRNVADAVAEAVASEAKRQGATNVRGDEIGYTRGETTEFAPSAPEPRTPVMNVTVTGASGLIGSKIRAALQQRGDEVIPVSVRQEVKPEQIGDAVVHLAGENVAQRWTDERARSASSNPASRARGDLVEGDQRRRTQARR